MGLVSLVERKVGVVLGMIHLVSAKANYILFSKFGVHLQDPRFLTGSGGFGP